MVYSYYIHLLHLMKIGIPYDSILSMDNDEINMIMGVDAAMSEMEHENAQMQADLHRSQMSS